MRISLEEVFLQVTTEEKPRTREREPPPSEAEARVEGEAPNA